MSEASAQGGYCVDGRVECVLFEGPKKAQAIKELTTMALESDLPIPGESSFPFAGLYKPPANSQEEGERV